LLQEKIEQILFGFLIILLISGTLLLPSLISGKASYSITETHHAERTVGPVEYHLPPQNPYQNIENLRINPPRGETLFPEETPFSFQLIGGSYFQVKYTANIFDEPQFFEEEPYPYRYLGPERAIETDHPLLIYTARQITASGENGEKVLEKLRDFIKNDFQKLPLNETTGSALMALENRKGSQADLSLLLTGLSRTRGIPARTVGGVKVPVFLPWSQTRNLSNTTWWTETYNPETGWTRQHIESSIISLAGLEKPFLQPGTTNIPGNRVTVEVTLNWHNTATWLLVYWGTLLVVFAGGFLFIRYKRSSSSSPEDNE